MLRTFITNTREIVGNYVKSIHGRIILLSILLLFLSGIIFRWTINLRIVVFLIIFGVSFEILLKSKWLVEKANRFGVAIIAIVFALLLTSWLILIQISILPENINVRFENLYTTLDSFPGKDQDEQRENAIDYIQKNVDTLYSFVQTDSLEDGTVLDGSLISLPEDTVGNVAIVQITAIPKPKRVFILIHPHNTQFWYVQKPATYKIEGDNQYWEGNIYFGSIGSDCDLKFDLIAVASKEWGLVDVFRGRGLRAGMKLDYLPVLNQSETIVVRKLCMQR